MEATLSYARQLDREDDLAHFRDEFVFTEPDLIYMDGNSLGRLPKKTAAATRDLVDRQWGDRLIRGWNEGWYRAANRIGAKIAGLIGAREDEVVVSDSTSVVLFKLVVAALMAKSGRKKIITDELNFPSNIYILEGAQKLMGQQHSVEIVASPDGLAMPLEQLAAHIDADTALVSLSHVVYKSGFVYNLTEFTALANGTGALALWDLSHSVGAIPIDLGKANVPLAVGCTYKYLNGGPGSPAFLYVRRDLQEELANPIPGWFGQRNQFGFDLAYQPAEGIQKFLTGTPPVLSMAGVETGVDLVLEAGIDRLRAKSVKQSEYLIFLWKEWLEPLGFALNSPVDPDQRGSHISLGHEEAFRVTQALIAEMNVIPDFREPDNIRLGIAPIYTSFEEVYEAAHRLRRVVEEKLYEKYPATRPEVT